METNRIFVCGQHVRPLYCFVQTNSSEHQPSFRCGEPWLWAVPIVCPGYLCGHNSWPWRLTLHSCEMLAFCSVFEHKHLCELLVLNLSLTVNAVYACIHFPLLSLGLIVNFMRSNILYMISWSYHQYAHTNDSCSMIACWYQVMHPRPLGTLFC